MNPVSFATVAGALENAFGVPRHINGSRQWAVPEPRLGAIHVILTDASSGPAVWVFDPHDRDNSVACITVKSLADIAMIVYDVEQRAERIKQGNGLPRPNADWPK